MQIDYWALASALGGVLRIAIMIWMVSYLDSVLGIMHRAKGSLLDHLIGASEERWRDRHT